MASNFFQQQDRARANSFWLILLFIVGVVGIVATTTSLAYAALEMSGSPPNAAPDLQTKVSVLVSVAAGTLAVILLGTLFKTVSLRAGGGTGVAESLGGRRIVPSTADAEEKRILNVVEEMAIASGTPVPPVFLLNEEQAINAFAAGYSPQDAVIGVTRGAIHQLNREQLQGVIAHEFSHILNGDMRLGIRVIGIIHGIILLNLLGRFLMRIFLHSGSARRSSSNKNSGGILLAVIVVSVALILIGAIGSMIGNLIKAALSRQREYLADASAVQFTRNPEGLSGALKRIGGLLAGSRMKHPRAAEASHLYFACGVQGGFASLFSSHPPLEKRIRAIEPSWDGRYPQSEGSASSARARSMQAAPTAAVAAFAESPVLRPDQVEFAVDHVGNPKLHHQRYARQLLDQIPTELAKMLREPFSVRAVLFAMLIDRQNEIAIAQFRALEDAALDKGGIELTRSIYPQVLELSPLLRLPMVDLGIASLRSLTAPQFEVFDRALEALIRADQKLTVFEWGLSQIIRRHVRPEFGATPPPKVHIYGLQRLGPEVSILLSTVSHVGNASSDSKRAFASGAQHLADCPLEWLPAEECSLAKLEQALNRLLEVSFKQRGRIIDAATRIVCDDGRVQPREAELLRGIADMLQAPVPPVLPGQPLA